MQISYNENRIVTLSSSTTPKINICFSVSDSNYYRPCTGAWFYDIMDVKLQLREWLVGKIYNPSLH